MIFLKKAFLCGLFGYCCIYAYQSPGQPIGFVNDFAQALNVQERQSLEHFLDDLKQRTKIEIVICLINTIGNDTIENFAEKLFLEWAIGDREQDTGVLLLVARNDLQVRIETGYGIEPIITDAHVHHIINTLIMPAFKLGNFYDGIQGAIKYMAELVDPKTAPKKHTHQIDWSYVIFALIIIALLIDFIFNRLRKHGTLFTKNKSSAFISSTTKKVRNYRWFGGSTRSGSDRFNGFGGGKSGGGGGSGKW